MQNMDQQESHARDWNNVEEKKTPPRNQEQRIWPPNEPMRQTETKPNHLPINHPRDEQNETLEQHLHYIASTEQKSRPKHLQVNEASRPNQAQKDPNPGTERPAENTDPQLMEILELQDKIAEQGYP